MSKNRTSPPTKYSTFIERISPRFDWLPGSHTRFERLATLVADHTATAEEVAEFTAHIESCADCKALVHTIQFSRADLKARPQMPMPDGLSLRLMAALDVERRKEQDRQRIFSQGNLRLAGAASAAALILVSVFGVHSLLSNHPAGPVVVLPASPGSESRFGNRIANVPPVSKQVKHDHTLVATNSEPTEVSPSVVPTKRQEIAAPKLGVNSKSAVTTEPNTLVASLPSGASTKVKSHGGAFHDGNPVNVATKPNFETPAPEVPITAPAVGTSGNTNPGTAPQQPVTVAQIPPAATPLPADTSAEEPTMHVVSALREIARNSQRQAALGATLAVASSDHPNWTGTASIVSSTFKQ